jgi:hypothetical protein
MIGLCGRPTPADLTLALYFFWIDIRHEFSWNP